MKAVKELRLTITAFETLEDRATFFSSELIKSLQASRPDSVEVKKATFQTSEFPANSVPKKYTQLSRITIDDGKKDELRSAWNELTTAVGQETWGGQSVSEGLLIGLGFLTWDSLEVSLT